MKIAKLLFLVIGVALMPAVAAAAPIVFVTSLDGPSEEPTNSSPGTGFSTVTIDPTAHTLQVAVSFSNLTTGTTASHIHVINGPGDANTADTAGPVVTTTPTFLGFTLGVTSGIFNTTLDTTLPGSYRPAFITEAGGTIALAEAALFSGIIDGRAYLNIHTTQFPGGEIRGFLHPVPEPASLLLLGTGVAALARSRKRRVQ